MPGEDALPLATEAPTLAAMRGLARANKLQRVSQAFVWVLLSAACSAVFSACTKSASESKPAVNEAPVTATSQAPSGQAATAQILDTYEALRKALAEDAFEGVPGLAKRLSTEASNAAVGDHPQRGLLAGLAQSAKAIAAGEDAEPDLLRKHFGEVSRHVVQLVSQAPALQEGRHVFECPMAQGYGRWVQKEATMANPYMGKKMLQCGTTVSWGS